MGTARMGSIEDLCPQRNNQVWDAKMSFVTDGACMNSAPGEFRRYLLALTARAAHFAVDERRRQPMSATPSARKWFLHKHHLLKTMIRREALNEMAWLIGGWPSVPSCCRSVRASEKKLRPIFRKRTGIIGRIGRRPYPPDRHARCQSRGYRRVYDQRS